MNNIFDQILEEVFEEKFRLQEQESGADAAAVPAEVDPELATVPVKAGADAEVVREYIGIRAAADKAEIALGRSPSKNDIDNDPAVYDNSGLKLWIEYFKEEAKKKGLTLNVEVEPEKNITEPEEDMTEPPIGPPEISNNFYDVETRQIVVLVKEKEEEKLKEIYLSIFNNQKDLAKNIKKLTLLRIIFSLANAEEQDIGNSQKGFDAINKFKDILGIENPNFELKGYFEFEKNDNLDQYGILLPDMARIKKRKSSLGSSEARDLQYFDYQLFDIIKNVNLKVEEYDEEEAETEVKENPPLDRRTNDPRLKDGRSAMRTPKLEIFYNHDTIFYGENDPLNLRKKKKYGLNNFTKKYFGITFEQYLRDLNEDVTRETVVKKKNGGMQNNTKGFGEGDIVVSVANFWPIHVAMAYEELYSKRTESSDQNIKEYDAILYFETAADKRKSDDQFEQLNKELRDEMGDDWPADLKYVPSDNQVTPGKIKKILEKRLAYFGATSSTNTAVNLVTGKKERVKSGPRYGNKNFGDISGVVGTSALRPLHIISQKAKDIIVSASGEKDSDSNLSLRVKSPGGKDLFVHQILGLFAINGQSQYPVEWDSLPGIGEAVPITKPLIVKYVPTGFPHNRRLGNTLRDNTPVTYGSIFFIPKNIVGNTEVNEDNVDPFTEAEKTFAKRVGVRLDQDFRVDLVTGKSNFADLNKYNIDGSVTSWVGSGDAAAIAREPEDSDEYLAPQDDETDQIEPAGGESTQGNIERQVLATAKKYNIAPDLILRHMWIESSYKQNVTSSKGAIGLMQLMPKTAKGMGVDPNDWKQNIDGGAKMLSRLIKRYQGVTEYPKKLASMAYYAGPGNIKKTIVSAKEEGLDPVIYVEKKKDEESEYHISIFNYADSIYNDQHRRQARRPKNIFIGMEPRGEVTGPISGEPYRKDVKDDDSTGYEGFEGFGKVQPISTKLGHNYGTKRTLDYLESLQKYGDGEWRVGDLSKKEGGGGTAAEGWYHSSHQAGQDVDIAIPLIGKAKHTLLTTDELDILEINSNKEERAKKRGWGYINASPGTIDLEKSIQLLSSLIDSQASRVLVDISIIKALKKYINDNFDNIEDKRLKRYSGKIVETEVRDKKGATRTKQTLGSGPVLQHWPGHKDHFHIRFGEGEAIKTSSDKNKASGNEALIFGHSQADTTSMGGALERSLTTAGYKVTRKSHPGHSDNSLANKALDKIPKKNYKQAFLFLNGNVYKVGGPLMGASKIKIIKYMIDTLNIQKENLTVILPPVNTDNEKSVTRKALSERALNFFRGKGIKVVDIMIGDKDSFSDDGIHASHDAGVVIKSMQALASGVIAKIEPRTNLPQGAGSGTVLQDEPEYGYILSDLKEEKVHSKYNEKIGENRDIFQGASMNKPIIALIHRMKYPKGTKKALTDGEIKGLLTYTAGGTQDSNNVNALISGGTNGIVHRSAKGKTKERLRTRSRSIGKLTVSDTKEYLKWLGLDENMNVRYTGNKHSPSQYHKFMKLIHDESKINQLDIKEEVNEVLKYMKRTGMKITVGGPGDGGDRESARWPKYIEALNEAGVPVKKIYGKGGLVRSTFHYSLVIDDKYLLTIYTNRLNPNERGKKSFFKLYKNKDREKVSSKDQHMSWFEGKLIEILKPLYGGKSKINETLINILKLIDEAME